MVKTETKKQMNNGHYGRGRRKQASARVTLSSGKGEITINGIEVRKYLGTEVLEQSVKSPLVLTGRTDKLDVVARVVGGGKRGQADAVKLGIARALIVLNEDFRASLKKAGLLTRDSREKERKKTKL